MERERRRRILDAGQVDLWVGVCDLLIHIGREVLFPDIEPDQGGCLNLSLWMQIRAAVYIP